MNTLQWITDRLPTKADAHPISEHVLCMFPDGSVGSHALGFYSNPPKPLGWLPMNNLPPVPVQSQAEKDVAVYRNIGLLHEPLTELEKTFAAKLGEAFRADLRKQLREIIDQHSIPADFGPHITISSQGRDKLIALAAEEWK